MPQIVLICSSILVAITLILAFWTSLQRTSSGVISYGAQLDPSSRMAKAQRAHGNSAEFSALLIVLFLLVGFAYEGRDLGALVTWTVISVTAARIVHAVGILTCATLEKAHPLKAVGAIVTYLGGLLLVGLVISKTL